MTAERRPPLRRLLFRALLLRYPRALRQRRTADMLEYLDDAWTASGAGGRMRLVLSVITDTAGARGQRPRRPGRRSVSRDDSRGNLMDDLRTDIRYAFRMLRRTPVTSAVAIVTLALGIGANTAIFSLVNSILLRPLPYHEPDRLVALTMSNARVGIGNEGVSMPDMLDLRAASDTLQDVGAYGPMGFTLVGEDGAENIPALFATPGLFSTLGVAPLHGRVLQQEDTVRGNHRVVVMSHALWQERFGADLDLVEQTLNLDGERYRVVGVMPPGFRIPQDEVGEVGFYTPMPYDPSTFTAEARSSRWMHPIGRLAAGYGIDQARAELRTIAQRLEASHPDSNDGWEFRATSLHRAVVGDARIALLVLQGAVGFVLLIACVNVANLLLARVESRQTEIGLRAALGAGRRRLLRQLLTESTILALIGCAVGLLLATAATGAFVRLVPPELSRIAEIRIDVVVLGFSVLVALATGLVFGLMPGRHLAAGNASEALREGSARVEGRGRALRGALVVAEVGLALVLLIGAGLLIRSFAALVGQDLGMDPDDVLTFIVAPGDASGDARADLYTELAGRIERLPGVESVGAVTTLPLGSRDWPTEFEVVDGPQPDEAQPRTLMYHSITPGYFDAIGARLLRGRDFTLADRRDTGGVAIINRETADRFFEDIDPLGQRVSIDMRFGGNDPSTYEIVGIVADVRDGRPDDPFDPGIYVPFTQQTSYHMYWVVRTRADPAQTIAAIRSEWHALAPSVPVDRVATMNDLLSQSVADRRFNAVLLGTFAAVALLLAAVGVYGVMSTLVTERTREIGIRMALGANPKGVLQLVVGEALAWSLGGIVLGIGAGLALSRWLADLVYGIRPTDPGVFGAVSVAMLLVAATASYLPARRATRIDPLDALRGD